MRYVAFIRGLNNVGSKTVKMAELKRMFESLGFHDASTYKASGNVIFDSGSDAPAIAKKIEGGLFRLIGNETRVVLRTMDDLKRMVASDPFKGIKAAPKTTLCVTFLPEKPRQRMKAYEPPDRLFRILRANDTEIYSVVILSPEGGAAALMRMIYKECGKNVTTRNWSTVAGIVEAES